VEEERAKMATFMDIGILSEFSIFFVFLFVFTIIFSILEYANPFGKDKKGLHGLIAISVSILLVISKAAVLVIQTMTPWFMILFLFIVLLLMAVRIFGVSESDTMSIIKDTIVYPYVIVIAVIIMISAFSSAFGQILLEKGTGIKGEEEGSNGVILPGDIEGGSTKTTSFGDNVLNTLFHPKVLGVLALLILATFTLTLLTKLS